MILSWREIRSGIVKPDERLPWGQSLAMGFQHILAMFGATVVAPIIMGFDPNLAILFSGIGTLIFFAFVGGEGRVSTGERADTKASAADDDAGHSFAVARDPVGTDAR